MAKKERYRPKLDVPRSPWQTLADIVGLVGVVVLVTYPMITWGSLPARIPTHFDAAGDPDDWGSRAELIIMPAIGALMWVGLSILARYPHIFNFAVPLTPENAAVQYRMARTFLAVLSAEMVWLFVYIVWGTIQVALGERDTLGAAVVIGSVVVMLGTTAAYIALSVARR